MTNKLLTPLFTALILLIGCSEGGVVIKGNLLNAEGETAVIEKLSSASTTPIDSVEIGKDGEFKLNIAALTEAGFYRLRINANNFIILLLEEGENIEISGNALDFYKSYVINGSEGSASLQSLDQTLRRNFEKTDSLRKVFQSHQQAGISNMDSVTQAIDAVYQQMQQEKRSFVLEFIDEHPNSLASLSAVQALSPDQDMDVFNQVAENLNEVMPESDYVKSFKASLATMKSKQQAAERTNVGSVAPEIALQTPDGNTIKLTDFRGKVTMIDFWASWCKPCRMENPNVVRVYNRFKDQGFEIYGVSLDKDRNKWVEAIAQDGLTWKHGSELKFWQSSFVPVYNLEGIPMTYLLDKNGIIIAKGLRGDQLEQRLEELFNS